MKSEFARGVSELEDGRVVRVDERGAFELIDGVWSEPSAPFSESDIWDGRAVRVDELAALMRSGK